MFDEQKEPEDIFSETEPAAMSSSMLDPAAQAPGMPGGAMPEPAPSRGPSKLIFVLVVLIVLGLVGGGVWFFFLRDKGVEITEDPTAVEETADEPVADEPEVSAPNCGDGLCEAGEENVCPEDCAEVPIDQCGNGICDSDESFDDCPIDCPPPEPIEPVIEPEPANQPLDTDGDGLSDDEERELGTNPQVPDTDSDGLSDREEVQIYNTIPTNPDTDGDSYIDGDEVKAGYNPNGDGKLLNIPQ